MTFVLRSRIIKIIILIATLAGGVLALTSNPIVVQASCNGGVEVTVDGVVKCNPKPVCETFNNCIEGVATNSTGTQSSRIQAIAKFILEIARIMTFVAAAVSVLYIVLGGWFILTSTGEAQTFAKGVEFIRNAVVGLIVCILALLIVQWAIGFVESLKTSIKIPHDSSIQNDFSKVAGYTILE